MTAPAVAWYGLGALGLPLALRLRQAGHTVAAVDPDPRALATWREAAGADRVTTGECAVAVTCVTDEAAAEVLYLGPDGLATRLSPGTLVIDHTTTSPGFARCLAARLAACEVGFVDAPLSGGVRGAHEGRMLAMLGGSSADQERAGVVLGAYCARMAPMGAAGCGQAAKLANQIAIAGTLAGLDAAERFARGIGLDVTTLFGALAAGSAHSAQMDQHAARLAASEESIGSRFGWVAKDLELARDAARAAGVGLPLADWLLPRLAGEKV
jgi:3-hydroxyisobutyrate dehydrogenase-like beta-hydroxyacid dehydrogenase